MNIRMYKSGENYQRCQSIFSKRAGKIKTNKTK